MNQFSSISPLTVCREPLIGMKGVVDLATRVLYGLSTLSKSGAEIKALPSV